jgi:hypothetical protein
MLKKTKTSWGFDLIEFSDHNCVQCSLEKSSLASDDAVWLGVDSASPMATRMHLTKEQVKQLIPVLQAFVDTGDIG